MYKILWILSFYKNNFELWIPLNILMVSYFPTLRYILCFIHLNDLKVIMSLKVILYMKQEVDLTIMKLYIYLLALNFTFFLYLYKNCHQNVLYNIAVVNRLWIVHISGFQVLHLLLKSLRARSWLLFHPFSFPSILINYRSKLLFLNMKHCRWQCLADTRDV